MIVRFWLVTGVLLTVVAWALTVIWAPADHQLSATSMADSYRAAGMLPPAGELTMSSAIGHDVFEIPETDARHAVEEAIARGGDDQGTMPMKNMPMKNMPMKEMAGEAAPDEEATPDKGMPMEMMADKSMAATDEDMPMKGMPMKGMPMKGMPKKGMPMKEMAAKNMPMKAMPMEDGPMEDGPGMGDGHGAEEDGAEEHGGTEEAEEMGGHGGGGPAFGMTILAEGRPGTMTAMKVSRTVEIKMMEWGYAPANLMVKPGEVLRLVVRNAGNMPHEFMLMQQAGMQAVNYRLERADWTLTEHEALFEKPVVMPGDSFELIVRIEKPGMWMFMCMFPYHMQMGMMGMLMTEGASMGGMKMGGMKMDMGGGSMGGMKMDMGGGSMGGMKKEMGGDSMGGMKKEMGGDSMGGMKMPRGGAMPDQGGKESMQGMEGRMDGQMDGQMDGKMDGDAPAKMDMGGGSMGGMKKEMGGGSMGGMKMDMGGDSMGGMKKEMGGDSMGGMKMPRGGAMPDQGGKESMQGMDGQMDGQMDGKMDGDAPAKMNMGGDDKKM